MPRKTNSNASGGRPPHARRLRFRRPPDFWHLDVYGSYDFHKLWNQRFIFGFKYHAPFSPFSISISSSFTKFTNMP
jgi:hypothetical protein